MAGTNVDVSTGLTVVFGTSAFTGDVIGLTIDGITRVAVDTSHMATAAAGAGKYGNMTFISGDLSDPGSLGLEIHFNPETTPPIDLVAETITITWPLAAGDSTAAKFAASGFCTDIGIAAPLDDKMVQSLTFKISGNVTLTAAT